MKQKIEKEKDEMSSRKLLALLASHTRTIFSHLIYFTPNGKHRISSVKTKHLVSRIKASWIFLIVENTILDKEVHREQWTAAPSLILSIFERALFYSAFHILSRTRLHRFVAFDDVWWISNSRSFTSCERLSERRELEKLAVTVVTNRARQNHID